MGRLAGTSGSVCESSPEYGSICAENEIGNECESTPESGHGPHVRAASPLTSEGPHLQALSGQALRDAFGSATFSAPRVLSPWELLRMGIRDEPAAEIFRDERFLRAWGYANSDDLRARIGFSNHNGQINSGAREFFRPLRQWALHGKVDKAQFSEIRRSPRMLPYFRLFAQNELNAEQLWDIARLFCQSKPRKYWAYQKTGAMVAYARGSMSRNQVGEFLQGGATGEKLWALLPDLLASGGLNKGWERHVARLLDPPRHLDMALGGFIEPELFDAYFAGGSFRDEALCRYFGVDDLSRLKVSVEDVQRANHSEHLDDFYFNPYAAVGQSISCLLKLGRDQHLILYAEIRRRLERERAAAAAATEARRINAGNAATRALASRVVPICILS